MNCFKLMDLEQGTPEWHKFRKNHIGASDAPVIMNKSPWKTPYQLWQEKLGLVSDNRTSAAMQRGIDLEGKARDKFMHMTGILVMPAVASSTKYPFMAASFDGLSTDGTEAVEIKCPGEEDHTTALNNKVPEKYFYQLLQQMIVLGIDHIHYFSYRSDSDVAVVTVNLSDSEKYAEGLISEEKKFWQCIQNLQEPELVTKDFIEINDIEWSVLASEYLELQPRLKELKEMEKQEKMLKERLISMTNNKNSQGAGIRLTRGFRKGNVDYSTIPELKNINLENYRKPMIELWRIS